MDNKCEVDSLKRIFVSSTFRDMQHERDSIHKEIVPILNDKARKYGESVELLDLRWGINTGNLDEETGAKKVLKVCLNSIDQCEPYIIILIGDRYGWVPPLNLVRDIASEKNFKIDKLDQSVTALEIEYGAFSRSQKAKCLIYFREMSYNELGEGVQAIYCSESDVDKNRLEALKQRLKITFDDKVKTYSPKVIGNSILDMTEFSQMLIADLTELLLEEWTDNEIRTWQQREENEIQNTKNRLSTIFCGREYDISKCLCNLNASEDINTPLVITGISGSGKSVLLSALAERTEKDGNVVLSFYCGNSEASSSTGNMLKYFIFYMKKTLEMTDGTEDDKNNSFENDRREFTSLCERFLEQRKERLFIIIDSLDKLYQDETVERLLFRPLVSDERIKIVVSALPEQNISVPSNKIELGAMTNENSHMVINNLLKARAKDLDEEVIASILNHPGSNIPLFIDMLTQRLMMFENEDFLAMEEFGSGMGGINKYLMTVVRDLPDNIEELCTCVINEAARKISSEMSEVLKLIAVSKNGLRCSDLETILINRKLNWSILDFEWLIRYLPSCFRYLDDGRVDFTHKSIREGYRKEINDIGFYNELILSHFKMLPSDDSVRESEILYHAFVGDDKETLLSYVENVMENELGLNRRERKIACREIKSICLVGGVSFVLDALVLRKDNYTDCKYLDFLVTELYYEFERSLTQTEVLLKIISEVIRIGDLLMSNYLEEMSPDQALKLIIVIVYASFEHGKLLRVNGDLVEAVQCFENCIKISEMLERSPVELQTKILVADVYEQISQLNEYKGDTNSMLEPSVSAASIREEIYAFSENTQFIHLDIMQSYSDEAEILKNAGRYDDAFEILARSVDAARQQLPHTREMLSILLGQIGEIFEINKEFDKAVVVYEEALRLSEERSREENTSNSQSALKNCYGYLGYAYTLVGRNEDAIVQYNKALTIAKHLLELLNTDDSKRDVLVAQNNLCEIFEQLNELDKAEPLRKTSLVMATELYRKRITTNSQNDFAVALFCYGRYVGEARAREYVKHALLLWEKINKEEPRQLYEDRIAVCRELLGTG